MRRFDERQVRQYYDRHTAAFMTFGRSRTVGAIHRSLWAPGVETPAQAFHYIDDLIATLVRQLPPAATPPHVVDLGCGIGASLTYLAARLPIRGTGITLSPVQARLAAARVHAAGVADRVVCLEGSYASLPPQVGVADLAYAIESFAHAADPAGFFAQCARLLRPGGVLAICDDVRRSDDASARRTIDRVCRGWHLNALLYADQWRALARDAGFRHESTTDLSPHLRPTRRRERLVDALLGWLPPDTARLGPVLGGAALQRCLERGWTGYELSVFRRA